MNRLHAAMFLSMALGCGAPPVVETPPDASIEASIQPSEIRLSNEAVTRSGITTAKVQLMAAPNVLLLPGQVALNEDRTVTAGAFVEGIVTECCKAEGSYVEAGQILAELHSHQTHELLGEYRSAQATLEARQSEHRLAEQAAARARRLLELKAGSARSVEQADSAREVAATAVVSAEAQLESALAHFEYLGVATDELRRGEAPDHLRVVVRSPGNGVIVERAVAQGDVVSPSDVLYRIADLSQVWVLARASEQQLSRLSTGMAATFQVRAYGDRQFSGRLLRVSNSLDPDTKTIEVVVAVSNPNRSLKTGMYGDVELRSSSTDQVLAVPEDAVQLIDSQSTVFVATSGGVFTPREVAVGRSINRMEEILSGVEAGESVVVTGAFALKSDLLKSRFAEE
jgi:cobalt-zinc-cadmium efflux system membrane fusion protein